MNRTWDWLIWPEHNILQLNKDLIWKSRIPMHYCHQWRKQGLFLYSAKIKLHDTGMQSRYAKQTFLIAYFRKWKQNAKYYNLAISIWSHKSRDWVPINIFINEWSLHVDILTLRWVAWQTSSKWYFKIQLSYVM